jgi:carbonic anhydrase
MHRRAVLQGFLALSLCPLCSRAGLAAEVVHWSYEGGAGPDHWGSLAKDNAACSVGGQQSPVDIVAATEAKLPELKLAWRKEGGRIVNNGHTIQVNVRTGSTMSLGDDIYELVQFHFHGPSEHLVEGRHSPMEVHFVHRKQSGGLGVVGVLLDAGAQNAAFSAIAAAFPEHEGEAEAPAGADPNGFLPPSLKYWRYEGSLTTPPCTEVVDWIVLTEPVKVAETDVAKFAALFPMNARPPQPINRRFILLAI